MKKILSIATALLFAISLGASSQAKGPAAAASAKKAELTKAWDGQSKLPPDMIASMKAKAVEIMTTMGMKVPEAAKG